MKILNIKEYLESKIIKTNKCWEWTGLRHKQGYGKFKGLGVHRIFYELYKGKIPDGMLVCHSCDNPPCCNPKHLFLGTHKDNMQDMIKKNRNNYIGNPAIGDKHGNTKIKDDEISIIKNSKLSTSELAKIYNVSYWCIYDIRTRNKRINKRMV